MIGDRSNGASHRLVTGEASHEIECDERGAEIGLSVGDRPLIVDGDHGECAPAALPRTESASAVMRPNGRGKSPASTASRTSRSLPDEEKARSASPSRQSNWPDASSPAGTQITSTGMLVDSDASQKTFAAYHEAPLPLDDDSPDPRPAQQSRQLAWGSESVEGVGKRGREFLCVLPESGRSEIDAHRDPFS